MQDVTLALVNFNGLVLLCPIWSFFVRTLYSPHRTSKDLFFCVLCGHVSLVQDVILSSSNFNGLILLCPIWSSFAKMLYSPHRTSKDLFFCVSCGHVSLVQDVILTSSNFNGLILLCPIWLCLASAGRYTPFIELQKTCSSVSYMVTFC